MNRSGIYNSHRLHFSARNSLSTNNSGTPSALSDRGDSSRRSRALRRGHRRRSNTQTARAKARINDFCSAGQRVLRHVEWLGHSVVMCRKTNCVPHFGESGVPLFATEGRLQIMTRSATAARSGRCRCPRADRYCSRSSLGRSSGHSVRSRDTGECTSPAGSRQCDG